MCEPTTIAAVAMYASIASAGIAAYSAYNTSETNKTLARHNADVAEVNAQDAQRRGEQQAQAAQRQARLVQGAQRAGFAAKGLDISEGTPGDLIAQTDFFGQADAATARTNARKEAWNIRSQKAGYQLEAASYNPALAATGSLLGSSGMVADRWQQYKRPAISYAGG